MKIGSIFAIAWNYFCLFCIRFSEMKVCFKTTKDCSLFPSSVENCVFFCHLFFWRHDDFFV